MRLARFSVGDRPLLGVVVDGGVVGIARHLPALPDMMTQLIAGWSEHRDAVAGLARHEPDHALEDVRFLAPVERPGKIMAIGLNYADHIAETGRDTPSAQTWFAKMSSAINGPFDPIQLPRVSEQLDYEAELVAVIGKRCRHVAREDAAGVIFGLMAGNDVSVRDWQRKSSQFVIGKSFDSHAPVGPWIVTSDAIDPHGLSIRCDVNGERRQDSDTSHLIFDLYDQIAELSAAMTLEPGDLIFTGTPSGVGMAMDPPCWLKDGDVVRVEIEGIGAIDNRVEAETR